VVPSKNTFCKESTQESKKTKIIIKDSYQHNGKRKKVCAEAEVGREQTNPTNVQAPDPGSRSRDREKKGKSA
jgi:hypothetical protein